MQERVTEYFIRQWLYVRQLDMVRRALYHESSSHEFVQSALSWGGAPPPDPLSVGIVHEPSHA